MHNTVSYTVPLFSFRNPSSPGRHSFIWSIDFTNSWEIQVREMSSVCVGLYKWENVNVAPVIDRLVFSYAVPSRKTPGSMLTVFACKYCDHIVDGRTAVIDMALSSNSTVSASQSLCAAAETPLTHSCAITDLWPWGSSFLSGLGWDCRQIHVVEAWTDSFC